MRIKVQIIKRSHLGEWQIGRFYNLPEALARQLIADGCAIGPAEMQIVGPSETKPAEPSEIKRKKKLRSPTSKASES